MAKPKMDKDARLARHIDYWSKVAGIRPEDIPEVSEFDTTEAPREVLDTYKRTKSEDQEQY